MAWIKVPPAHHPLFRAALPSDRRVETMLMFGGIAAKVNGHMFAGLFGRSTIVLLDDLARADALALDGAAYFDPMGNGRLHSDKVMLPEDVMHDPVELRSWIARAFATAAALPKKTKTTKKAKTTKTTETSKTTKTTKNATKAVSELGHGSPRRPGRKRAAGQRR